MRVVTTKELSTFKILPFDVYDESNVKISTAGEIMTPGKLIMLKNYHKIFTNEYINEPSEDVVQKYNSQLVDKLANFSFDSLSSSDFDTIINSDGVLKDTEQIKIKYYYRKVLDLFLQGFYKEGVTKLNTLVNIMISSYFKILTMSKLGSQVRFLGEYEICHSLNVAVMSGLIAQKLDYSKEELMQIVLAALLHDIGKFKINVVDSSSLTTTNEEEIMRHTILGYNLIKNELNLSENIARVALEHHEKNDGSGYPRGLSSDSISEWSQIVNVANLYDNLAFNRRTIYVESNREALKAMLEVGTSYFATKILYTFIHMFSYDDPKDFSEMTI